MNEEWVKGTNKEAVFAVLGGGLIAFVLFSGFIIIAFMIG